MAKFVCKKVVNSSRLRVTMEASEGDEISADEALAYALLGLKSALEEIRDYLPGMPQNVPAASEPSD